MTVEHADGSATEAESEPDRETHTRAEVPSAKHSKSHIQARATQVGRYVVHGELGLGGMGVVLDAHDPDLNRRVAIKMLRSGGRDHSAAWQRLLREAQALARLSHPNVVAVYDVGTTDAGIYVAMEYVSGPTIAQWLKQPRTPAQILAVFGEAGRGLAAAHAADLVHRDFKPANVIIGDDGRVRVLDFGLARAAHIDERDGEPRHDTVVDSSTSSVPPDETSLESSDSHDAISSRRSRDHLEVPITMFGTVVGTPRYMAPEQHSGAATGPPADVFAFCVALYEALFNADSNHLKRLLAGKITEPPVVDGVPAHIRRIIMRGLAKPPEQRPTMAEVLRELARDRWRTLRYAAIGVAVVAASATGAVAMFGHHQAAPCEGGERQLAGVWDDAARSAVRARFADASQPHVAAATQRVVLTLDDYSRRWALKYRDVCTATNVEHKQSTQLMDQRMACLDARRTQLAALIQGLVDRNNSALVDDALSASASLVDLDSCDDVEHFGPTVALPALPSTAQEVVALRTEMAGIVAQVRLGEVAAALPKAKSLAARADKTGFLPVRAEAADLYAFARLEAADFDGIESLLESMIVLGAQAKNDHVVATGWIELMRLKGTTQARPADALALRFAAEGAVHRAGDPADLDGDYYVALADIYDVAANFPASRDAQQRALDILKKSRGPHDVSVGAALVNLGSTQFALSDYDRALAYFEEALAIYEQQVGPDSPRVAIALTNIAQIKTEKFQLAEALPMLQRALSIKERAFGPNHRGVGVTLLAIADVHARARRYEEALPFAQRSYAILSAALAPGHPHVATAATDLGHLLVHLGKYDEGCALIDKAAPTLLETYKLEGAAQTVMYQAECRMHGGQAAAAVDLLAPAIAAVDPSKDPWMAGMLRFRGAQAEAAAAGHLTRRCSELAKEAEALLVKHGAGAADDLADLRAWVSRAAR